MTASTLPTSNATAPHASVAAVSYVPALDSVRAVAVLSVLLLHWGCFLGGWVGVQAFFVLSGYLITVSLMREKARSMSFGEYIRAFYMRRSLRIFPLYYAYIIIFFLFNGSHWSPVAFATTFTINIAAILPQRVNLSGIGHFWSLAVEEQFYLVWPFVIFFCRRQTALIGGILILCPLLRAIAFPLYEARRDANAAGELVNFITPFQADAFAFGALVAIAPNMLDRLGRIGVRIVVAIAVVAATANTLSLLTTAKSGFMVLSSLGFPYLMTSNFQYIWGYTVVNLLTAILIYTLLSNARIAAISA